jgi:hypothetical protein
MDQPLTGVLHAGITPDYPASALASWNGDSLTVHTSPDVGLPGSVVLHFRLDFTRDTGSQTANPVNKGITINGIYHAVEGYTDLISYQPVQYDAKTNSFHQSGTFDLKLALHPDGVSDPFSLSLSSGQYVSPHSMGYLGYWTSTMSLSLTGVTLPDGTPLTSDGYGTTFASGLTLPEQPVPEPAAWFVWSLLAGSVVVLRRGHRAFVPDPDTIRFRG